ncbi:MAG: hypothetical protein M2R45_04283 [Verrucomicrobia subdivision 3 bacterium]|nr:hypothetical protein [Limisphaerales bacterium]MCS1417390.1 hypothetical protein [Limisphaerales bacterium]
MSGFTIGVVSDIHFAGAAERERVDYESKAITNPWLRAGIAVYRRYFWLRDVFAHNHLLDYFIQEVGEVDDAALASSTFCLSQLRNAFPSCFIPVLGDHELGKKSVFGGIGGMRLASWGRA